MEDRYEILDVVARGTMATVWRARDARLGRVVAIKRPHATQDGGTTDSAFAAAARSAAAVTHPNLVTIFDTGTDATGPYLVMEYVDGPTLAEMGGASGGAAALGSDVASGLSALHSAGFVHRDVRPSNILLGPTGPKLTNFGTARTLDATIRSSVATPRFEAPEVLAGTEPGKPADVYSLGAVLAWLAGQTSPDQTMSSVIDQMTLEEPEARPTAATLAERLRKIAATSVTAVSTAPLVAAPADDDATRHFDSAPVPASEEPVSEPESPKRGRRLAALIAVVLTAFIVAVVTLAGDEDPLPAAVDTTTVDPAATTTAPSSVVTDGSDTTVAEESGGVFSTVRIFVTFIRETPRNVLSASGAEEIISDVTDGV
ncbi:MAG: protein kinase, partial [Acidimicrobiia bacterium]|nr:protein kinase [Acidimicrobiia bacterium]